MSVTTSQGPKVSAATSALLESAEQQDIVFEIGAESFAISRQDNKAERSKGEAVTQPAKGKPQPSAIESEPKLNPISLHATVTMGPEVSGEFPYNTSLTVSPLTSEALEIPKECFTVDASGAAVCSTTFTLTFGRGVISDGSHQTLFDQAPVRFHAGMKLGTVTK
ncbi:MAG: hypothetical protein J5J00_08300 [Deltaproteobacteria bacterium]|nr:hypothetical protein [Deltaproteobacteria bacterium]